MSATSSKDYGRDAQRPSPIVLSALDIWSPAVASGAEWYKKFHENCVALRGEWQDFVSRRLKADLDLMQELGGAKAVDEMWNVSAKFWQKAFEDYWREYAAMAKLTVGFIGSSITATQAKTDEAPAAKPPVSKAA